MALSANFNINGFLVDNLPEGLVVHDAKSAVIRANAMALSLLGRTLDEMLGITAYDPHWNFIARDGSMMRQSDYPANRAIHEKNSVSNVVLGIEHTKRTSIRWLICNAFPVFDDAGELQLVVVTFTDCTHVIDTQNALAFSEERLKLVLRGSNDGYWDWDLAKRTIFYSPRWWNMVGLESNARPCVPELWSELLHPNDSERVQEFLKEQLSQNTCSYSIECRLRHNDGHYIPVVSKGFILRDKSGVAIRIAGTNTDLSERKALEHQLEVFADHDYLTGLPNRRFLLRELGKLMARASRVPTTGAVLLIDLDNFKLLNDTEGHAAGDVLLCEVASRLQAAIRADDFVSRLGGDEFVVVLASTALTVEHCALDASHMSRKLQAVLSLPYINSKRSFSLTPSIGITIFDGHGESPELMLQQADIALYVAKSEGRNTVRFFDALMQRRIDERVALQSELAEAIDLGQLELYYQPQFDAARVITGAEALLRWNHPKRGLLLPASFIAIAESTDLILKVGNWVLNAGCARLAEWARFPQLHSLTLAINISARELGEDNFVEKTLATIFEHGAEPNKLAMELTESLLATDTEATIEKMTSLKMSGVNFSIDDFGTGFSSLQYIHRFPLEKLKIDRSFVSNCHVDGNSTAIVEIVIALANKLGLGNIAEGVETVDQLERLIDLGCTNFQGYLFGPPMPAEQFENLVLNS